MKTSTTIVLIAAGVGAFLWLRRRGVNLFEGSGLPGEKAPEPPGGNHTVPSDIGDRNNGGITPDDLPCFWPMDCGSNNAVAPSGPRDESTIGLVVTAFGTAAQDCRRGTCDSSIADTDGPFDPAGNRALSAFVVPTGAFN